MSEEFGLPPVQLMAPERARDIGRAYKSLADNLSAGKMIPQARDAERQSQWWLAYAITLAATKPEESGG